MRVCEGCGDYDTLYYHPYDERVYCAGCMIGDGICHLCADPIPYCQGHGNETCECIDEYGTLSGDCGFDELESILEEIGGYPLEDD